MSDFKVNKQKQLQAVLEDIVINRVRINQFIGDNPMRSMAKLCYIHSAWYACDYCFAKGSKIDISEGSVAKKRISSQINTIQEKINDIKQHETTPQNENKIVNLENLKEELQKTARKLKTKSNILWPSSTMNSEHRSRNKVLEIVRKLENGENLSVDETKGIKGRSLLLDLEDFNYIYDVPAEYLHSGCLGVVKRLVEMTFSVGVNRPRITKRKLSSTKTFNTLMSKVKVFKEFPRRARNLDFAVFKGQEFRNVCIFYFPIVIQCIEANAKERHLWLYLAYVVRACVIPTEEFIPLNINDIEDACEKYYKLYEKLFGPQNCTFNTHVFFHIY